MTGPSSRPDSSTQVVPVISPLPFRENHPPKTGAPDCFPRGQTAVTPVRTACFPSPEMSVVWPTSSPATSVIAFKGPGAPSNGTPSWRARAASNATAAISVRIVRIHAGMSPQYNAPVATHPTTRLPPYEYLCTLAAWFNRIRNIMLLLPLLLAIEFGESDADLVRRLQRRDPRAMAELYDRYGRLVYALILRVVRDGGIAEDLVQETFLRVWNRVHGFDADRGGLGPWLLAVARNRAIDYLRSAAGRMRNTVELPETEHPALFADMEKELLNSDRVRRVRVALEKLSQNHRAVIELAYFEGLSQAEMAERMGEPLGTVKTWVRTALKSLRDELGTAAVTA